MSRRKVVDGRLMSVTGNDGNGTSWSYASSTASFPTRRTEPDGTSTYLYYDGSNRLTKVTHPSMAANGIQCAYDQYGEMTSVTDALGNVSTYGFDAMGNMTSVTDPNSNTTTLYYDGLGRVTRARNALNKDTYLYYAGGCSGCSGGGQVTKVKDALNNETEFRYNANGNVTKVIDALDRETDYAYDCMGRLTQVTSPSGSGNSATLVYDLLGNVITKQDSEGKIGTYEYTFLGRMTKESDAVGSVEYTYDSNGQVSTVTDGEGHVFTYAYYSTGALHYVLYGGLQLTRYFYDNKGRATKAGAGLYGSIDPTEYFYNNSTGLLTKVRYTSGANSYDANYFYDGLARLTKMTDWIDGTDGLRYAYDVGGRLTRITDYDDSTLDYTYDAADRVVTMNDYHNNDVTYTYTDTGQVSTVTAPGSKTWTFTYNALGQPTSVSIPNGMTTEYGYDNQNRMTSIAHKDGSTVLDGFTYSLTTGGNITRTTHQDNAKWEYEYDGRERLTKAERYDTDGSTLMTRFSYSYDDADNMLSKVVYDARHNPASTASTAFTYDAANELTSSTTGLTPTTYAYDAWGRMTSKDYGPYTATYAYRYGSKLRSVTSTFPNEANVTYEYGGDQKRRERTSGGTTTIYNWTAGSNVINEEDGSGNLTMTYIGHTMADVAGSDPSTGTYRYYLHDNLASARSLRAQDKSLLGVYEYTPYGEIYAESDGNGGVAPSITHKYTGHAWDSGAGLYYAPFRVYSPNLGRWLTRDPLGMVDGPNLQIYLSGNPVNRRDPLGLCDPLTGTLVFGGLTLTDFLALAAAVGVGAALLAYRDRIVEASRSLIEELRSAASSVASGLGGALGWVWSKIKGGWVPPGNRPPGPDDYEGPIGPGGPGRGPGGMGDIPKSKLALIMELIAEWFGGGCKT